MSSNKDSFIVYNPEYNIQRYLTTQNYITTTNDYSQCVLPSSFFFSMSI